MLRFVVSIFSGIVIGVAGTLITLNWQEEKLRFALSGPATFGAVVYQNLQIANDGWNPATNVKLYLRHPTVTAANVQASPPFNLAAEEMDLVGGYDRVRRGETVTVTFSFRGPPIEATALSVKSDRSVARAHGRDGASVDALSLSLGALIGILLAVTAPGIHNLLHALHAAALRSITPRDRNGGTG